MTDYKKLKLWKAALEMLEALYKVTSTYPREEIYGLTSQTRRAAISILANIAEGLGRGHKKDSIPFLLISRGSGYEVEALLCMALKIRLLEQKEFEKIEEGLTVVLKMLNGLMNYIEKKYT